MTAKTSPRIAYDEGLLSSLRGKLSDYAIAAGIGLKRSGAHWKALCPIHEERTPSFSIYTTGDAQRFKCHGCGEGGDVFALSRALGRSSDFPGAVEDVARVLGSYVPHATQHPVVKPRPAAPRAIEWPGRLFMGNEGTWGRLATSRGISWTSAYVAAHRGVIRFCLVEGAACYVVTDLTFQAAEIRRLDRQPFAHGKKAYPLRGVNKQWLPGVNELEDQDKGCGLLITEGATDFLAAFDLYCRYRRAGGQARWRIAAMLGAGCRSISDECANLIQGRKVRLVPDGDEAGDEMREHWGSSFSRMGCDVSVLTLPRGRDLCDVAGNMEPEVFFA